MDKTDVTIRIQTVSRFRPLIFLRSIGFAACLILPGHYLGSSAMEWLGFIVVLFVAIIIVPASASHRDTGLTFDEARSRIDEIEKAQR